MLSQLYIENIAVIEKAGIDFGPGLNVLTGETGAGKSMVIDAINAVLGERTSRELVRTGARAAFVSATFTDVNEGACAQLEELGFSPEDGVVLIQREIGADGKTSCKVNGRPATVSMLKELGARLINIHGQHDSYDLLSPDLHVRYIDRMGVPDAILQEYRSSFEGMHALKKELSALQMDEAQKARQIDLLTYQIGELEAADIHIGEQDALTAKKTLYHNAEKITAFLACAKDALDGGEESTGSAEAAKMAADALVSVERYLPDIHPLAERVQSLAYELDDCIDELRGFSEGFESDPEEFSRVEDRLDLLYRMGRKYGGEEEEMLGFLENCRSELKRIQFSEEEMQRLKKAFDEARKKAEMLAAAISQKRRETAERFTALVKEELAFLNMPSVTFLAEQEPCELNAFGCDKLQFLISTNAGEPPKPISKIASGGELSRIMLAIKTVLADKDSVDTLIFDEVDTGVSGGAAQKVGLKLREASEHRQVLCVTHLAQIAALAACHYLIEKHVQEGKTYTNVSLLNFEGRKQELARIIGGAEVTALTLQNAAEMLELAAKH